MSRFVSTPQFAKYFYTLEPPRLGARSVCLAMNRTLWMRSSCPQPYAGVQVALGVAPPLADRSRLDYGTEL